MITDMTQGFFGQLFRRTIIALGVIFCFHAVPLELKASRQFKQVAKWPVTQALIRSSTVHTTSYTWSGKQNQFCPILAYEYTVQTQTYVGSNRVFDFVCYPDAYDFVAQHKPGAFVTIAYDPSNPAISIIPSALKSPGYPWGDVLGGIVFAVFLLVDIFASWALKSDQQR
ncbi:MAG: DUF3592 domain-containing protein [Terriglobales bacterium]|jgi:hypothetical protein